jgi:hypothetical protein
MAGLQPPAAGGDLGGDLGTRQLADRFHEVATCVLDRHVAFLEPLLGHDHAVHREGIQQLVGEQAAGSEGLPCFGRRAEPARP